MQLSIKLTAARRIMFSRFIQFWDPFLNDFQFL